MHINIYKWKIILIDGMKKLSNYDTYFLTSLQVCRNDVNSIIKFLRDLLIRWIHYLLIFY